MLLNLAKTNVWVTLLIWVVLYISDYALTLIGARLRAAQIAHISTGGSYELNTYFIKDIDKQTIFSVRFILALIWSTFALGIFWVLARVGTFEMAAFETVLGGFVLMELTIHIRHLRNIFTFRRQKVAGEIAGTIQFSRRYIYWTSAVDLALFAAFYMILFLFLGHVFFLGGALSCAALAVRHRLRVRREQPLPAV